MKINLNLKLGTFLFLTWLSPLQAQHLETPRIHHTLLDFEKTVKVPGPRTALIAKLESLPEQGLIQKSLQDYIKAHNLKDENLSSLKLSKNIAVAGATVSTLSVIHIFTGFAAEQGLKARQTDKLLEFLNDFILIGTAQEYALGTHTKFVSDKMHANERLQKFFNKQAHSYFHQNLVGDLQFKSQLFSLIQRLIKISPFLNLPLTEIAAESESTNGKENFLQFLFPLKNLVDTTKVLDRLEKLIYLKYIEAEAGQASSIVCNSDPFSVDNWK